MVFCPHFYLHSGWESTISVCVYVCVCWILVSFISISIVLIKKEEGPLPFPLLLVSPLELVASTSLLPFLDLYCQRARQTQPDCWVYLWPVCPRRWAERHQRPTRGERQTGSHAVVQLWNTWHLHTFITTGGGRRGCSRGTRQIFENKIFL